MHIGLVYPQIEYPTDPAAVRDYAQAAQSLRFTHIQANDHLQGANPAPPRGQPLHPSRPVHGAVRAL